MSKSVIKYNTHDLDVNPDILREGPRHPIHLVLDNVRSAFNVGSAFRTSDAAKVQKIYLGGITAYPPNKKLQKTALGSTEVVPWQYYNSTALAIKELKENNIPVYAVELTNSSNNFWEFSFPKPSALVFGHEVYGVDEDILSLVDDFIYIPMHGKKTSLNVSTSLGIVLFEVLRQWQDR